MSKLVTNDNLKAYHAELAEHIKLLQRNTVYVLDDIVNYDGITLKCTTAGTTNTTKPNISSLAVGSTYTDGTCVWTRIDPDKRGIDYWASSTTYALNDQVVYDNKIYKCVTAHTSTATFDTTKWTEISAGGGGGISIWQANTDYEVNNVVIDSNLMWQCATAHTSTSTFDESKWICISGGEISNGMEIVPLWEGSFSFSNSIEGATPTSSTPMIELSESINNYEYIYVATELGDGSDSHAVNVPISLTDDIRIGMFGTVNYFSTGTLTKYDNTHFYIKWNNTAGWQPSNVVKICGIRKAKPIVSSGMKYETLWEGEAGSITSDGNVTINLSDSVKKYKKIGINIISNQTDIGSRERWHYHEVDVDEFINFITSPLPSGIANKNYSLSWGYKSNSDAIFITNSSTTTSLNISYENSVITKVVGISEGVVIPTGVQAARVTLFEGSAGNAYGEGNYTLTLSDLAKNYDTLEFDIEIHPDANDPVIRYITRQVDVTTYKNGSSMTISFTWGFGNREDYLDIDNIPTNLFGTSANVAFSCRYSLITKIVGIKYIQPDSYSTEEKLIGTWIDDKPLYRKVWDGLSVNLPGSDAQVEFVPTGLSLLSIDKVINISGNIKGLLDYSSWELYIGNRAWASYDSSGKIRIGQEQTSGANKFYLETLILEYTKN